MEVVVDGLVEEEVTAAEVVGGLEEAEVTAGEAVDGPVEEEEAVTTEEAAEVPRRRL